jgi:hypothetical protein
VLSTAFGFSGECEASGFAQSRRPRRWLGLG